ncbi:hypothetical protein [Pseudonocardia broussonetiae]|uniref:Uncharacterized protein n=1 Tax=Pseudonocardia broussonetiae TaxID=2736640 RepID=A0A6M6JF79_9PSEU|nr:hypothetical protein [Pseudonocardia broussonetiae]QJY45141.1 hypothetical protein HOP40_04290 [Pseudonocardia broussonetiae]
MDLTPFYDTILDLNTRTSESVATPGVGSDVVEELRPFHSERFAEAWELTADPKARTRRRRERSGLSTAEYGQRQRNMRYRSVDELDDESGVPDWPLPAASVGDGRPDARVAKPVRPLTLDRSSLEAVRLDYSIEQRDDRIAEVATMLRSNDAYLAVRENRLNRASSSRRFDALKPVRAAAFAGIATISGEFE